MWRLQVGDCDEKEVRYGNDKATIFYYDNFSAFCDKKYVHEIFLAFTLFGRNTPWHHMRKSDIYKQYFYSYLSREIQFRLLNVSREYFALACKLRDIFLTCIFGEVFLNELGKWEGKIFIILMCSLNGLQYYTFCCLAI